MSVTRFSLAMATSGVSELSGRDSGESESFSLSSLLKLSFLLSPCHFFLLLKRSCSQLDTDRKHLSCVFLGGCLNFVGSCAEWKLTLRWSAGVWTCLSGSPCYCCPAPWGVFWCPSAVWTHRSAAPAVGPSLRDSSERNAPAPRLKNKCCTIDM